MGGSDSVRESGGDLKDDIHDPESNAAPNDNSGRIFRSSLCGMFEESQSSKTDSCALFCCGIYLWQRNQDILMQERRIEDGFGAAEPSSSTTATTIFPIIKERTIDVAMVFLFAMMFLTWLLYNPTLNPRFEIIFTSLFALCFIWKVWQFQGARKKFRRELAIAEYYRRRRTDINSSEIEDETDNDSNLAAFLEEHRQEIFGDGAHNLCGCARSDVSWFGSRLFRSSNNAEDERVDDRQGFCFNAWRCFSNIFCGVLCGCHIQLFGICATAQETRHLQEALPASTRRQFWQRDYITMQPWREYYPSILKLRVLNQDDWLSHFTSLSKLSRQILVAIAACLLFVSLTFLLPIRFPRWQLLILYGTLLQPVVFLFFVHWMWNRLILSFDAVVKYFACGFFVCTGCALVYEWVVSKIAIEFMKLVKQFGYDAFQMFGDDSDFDHRVLTPFWYQLAIAILASFIDAFIVAGFTEEICKYLCFWMVEHPDLEVDNKIILSSTSKRPESKKQTESSDTEVTETTTLLSQVATSTSSSDPEQQVIFAPRLPLVCIGEAITVAMVTLALGFACAENLLYIFVYTPPNLTAEIGTLYVRCLYPIHPMTAAIQSIGVCRRYLEKDSAVGVGRILLPALVVHGIFDFWLMGLDAIKPVLERHNVETRRDNLPLTEAGREETTHHDLGESIERFSFLIPVIAMMYYMYESNRQKDRLVELDKQNRVQR